MKTKKKIKLKFGTFIIFIIIIIFCCYIYARYIGTKGLNIHEYAVIDNSITESFDGFKIVHFSDVHYGMTTFDNELNEMVNNINKLRPDLVVFTGDFIDYNYKLTEKNKENIVANLLKINSRLGVYAVYGNHDQNKSYPELMEKSNIKILKNENIKIYNGNEDYINLIGLDDYLEGKTDLTNSFENIDKNIFSILLTHEPDIIDKIDDLPNVVFAGHSHNGQVRIPFIGSIYHVIGAKKYYDDYYQLPNSKVYISGGIGTSKLKVRFFNKPSINFYRLYTR